MDNYYAVLDRDQGRYEESFEVLCLSKRPEILLNVKINKC